MEFYILNKNFEMVSICDLFKSAIWTDRYAKSGDFEICVPLTTKTINQFKMGYYITMSDYQDHTMIVEDIKIKTDTEDGNYIIISGRSLESILERRIVWKQTTLDGRLEDQIEKLLNENIINPTDENRKIPNFIFKKSNNSYIESLIINSQFTGDELYKVIVDICNTYGIGFKISLIDEKFVFQLYSGINRSYNQDVVPYVVFSKSFDNVIYTDYYESERDYKNVTLVAGEDQGELRKISTIGSNVSGLERRELYTDARDITSANSDGTNISDNDYYEMLRQRGLEKLDECVEYKSFDGEIETTQLYRYNEHFFMGDVVEFDNEYDKKSTVRIVEFITCEDESGFSTYPTFDVLDDSSNNMLVETGVEQTSGYLSNKIVDISNEMETNSTDINGLKSSVNELSSSVSTNTSDINGLKSSVNELSSNVYTKSESDTKYRTKADSYAKSEVYTKNEVNTLDSNLQTQINNRYTKEEVNSMNTSLQTQINNRYTKEEVNSMNTSLQTQINDGFYDSGWLDVNYNWGIICRRIGKLLYIRMDTGSRNFIVSNMQGRHDLGTLPLGNMGIWGVTPTCIIESFGYGSLILGFKSANSVEIEITTNDPRALYASGMVLFY